MSKKEDLLLEQYIQEIQGRVDSEETIKQYIMQLQQRHAWHPDEQPESPEYPQPNYEAWQLVLARGVINWAYEESVRRGYLLNNPATSHTIGAIQTFLMEEVYRESGCKPVGRCTIEELEYELNKRKEK